eukprot:TRINITY_DN5010_c0_g1_i1.p1 TRINITY_DN5010_c0_g1~~TRINITY_DN5010_c0_g1_i1.p1  ORF type:complete len:82 (-),score=11.56 TRINITY_DN5010_c0_g1_i1:32-277(-)
MVSYDWRCPFPQELVDSRLDTEEKYVRAVQQFKNWHKIRESCTTIRWNFACRVRGMGSKMMFINIEKTRMEKSVLDLHVFE